MPPNIKFTGAPPPVRPPGGGAVRSAQSVDPELKDPAAQLEDDLMPAAAATSSTKSKTILLHVLEDGFTAHGKVWFRGQEIEYDTSDDAYGDTKDRKGVSWVDMDAAEQMQKWGREMFRPGPWPGENYKDARAINAEKARGRRPIALGVVAPGRR